MSLKVMEASTLTGVISALFGLLNMELLPTFRARLRSAGRPPAAMVPIVPGWLAASCCAASARSPQRWSFLS